MTLEETEGGAITAVARIEDRPIFRPIQYVGSYFNIALSNGSPEVS